MEYRNAATLTPRCTILIKLPCLFSCLCSFSLSPLLTQGLKYTAYFCHCMVKKSYFLLLLSPFLYPYKTNGNIFLASVYIHGEWYIVAALRASLYLVTVFAGRDLSSSLYDLHTLSFRLVLLVRVPDQFLENSANCLQ